MLLCNSVVGSDRTQTIKLMLDRGADAEIVSADEETALMLLCGQARQILNPLTGIVDTFTYLIHRSKRVITQKNSVGETAHDIYLKRGHDFLDLELLPRNKVASMTKRAFF